MKGKHVYIMEFDGFVKVGITSDRKKRLSSVQSELKNTVIRSIFSHQLDNAIDVESSVINSLADFHIIHDACKKELFKVSYDKALSVMTRELMSMGKFSTTYCEPDFATSIRLPESIKKKVEKKAKEEGRTINNMLNRIIEKAVA